MENIYKVSCCLLLGFLLQNVTAYPNGQTTKPETQRNKQEKDTTGLNNMEANIMQKEKKELLKKFKIIIDDLMDHYEEYTDDEKAQIKEIFQKVAELNTILDKYDIDVSANWEDYCNLISRYFTAAH